MVASGFLIGFLALAAVAGVVLRVRRSAGVVTAANRAALVEFCEEHRVPPTDASLRLVARYLGRALRYRTCWVWIGAALSVVVSLAWTRPAHLSFGLASFPPTSDVPLMALAGWFLGVLRCEAYNLRPRLLGPRLASLEPRSPERYAPRRLAVHARAMTGASCATVALDAFLPGPRAHLALVVAVAVAAVVVAIAGEGCQRAIARRRRPALSDDLVAADEAIRRLAARSVGYGTGGLVALLVAFQLAALATPVGGAPTSEARMALELVALLLFVWALVLAITAGGGAPPPLPPDDRDRPRGAC
jgi:hypothetical protein